MKLVHDIPENKGVENGIKRAKQMTEFRWTPVEYLPAVSTFPNMEKERIYLSRMMRPWGPQKGLIYSSVLKHQKFVGFNVSFEAYVTALSDPNSVMYKYNVDGEGRKNANCWYGVVCSCFASYTLGMKERWICRTWPTVDGVTCLGQPALEDLKLLDIVLNVKRHIAVITDILRDEAGQVRMVEVSESTLPLAKSTYFTPEEFRGFWYDNEFKIYRKTGLEKITYTPSPFVRIEADPERHIEGDPVMEEYKINRDILPDQGNGTNYKEAQEIVLDLLNDSWDGAEVTDAGGKSEVFDAAGGKVVIPAGSSFHRPGFYTAKAVNRATGEKSDTCAYAVTGLSIGAADGTYSGDEQAPTVIAPGAKIALTLSNPSGDPVNMVYIHAVVNSGERKRFMVTEENIRRGQITIEFPEAAEEYFVFESAENCYGEYASNYLYFKVCE